MQLSPRFRGSNKEQAMTTQDKTLTLSTRGVACEMLMLAVRAAVSGSVAAIVAGSLVVALVMLTS